MNALQKRRVILTLVISLTMLCACFVSYFTVSATENQTETPVTNTDTSSAVSSQAVSSTLETSSTSPNSVNQVYVPENSRPSSYQGGSSGTNEVIEEEIITNEQKKPGKFDELKNKYNNYIIIGIVVFGLLSLGMIAVLIIFNIRVKKSKNKTPDNTDVSEKNKDKKKDKNNARHKPRH